MAHLANLAVRSGGIVDARQAGAFLGMALWAVSLRCCSCRQRARAGPRVSLHLPRGEQAIRTLWRLQVALLVPFPGFGIAAQRSAIDLTGLLRKQKIPLPWTCSVPEPALERTC